jgi:undecaprenyl-diphosphatase
MDWLLEQDRALLLWINGLHTPFADVLMTFVSNKLVWIPLYALLLVVLIHKLGWKAAALAVVVTVGVILLSDQLASGLLKPLIQRARPCHVSSLQQLLHLVDGKCGGKYGFASSHAANFFGLAMIITGLLGRDARMLCVSLFIVAGTVALSRIYLGVHYPSDVFAGMIIGISIGWCGVLLFRKLHKWLNFPQTASN